MSVRKQIPYRSGMFFITFTNAQFIPLFEMTNSYNLVYKWFDYLRLQGHYVNAYVIMPNHLHAILTFTPTDKSINRIIGDGKRFMAYGIVKRLEELGEFEVLKKLEALVNASYRKRNKKHEVFEPSFDWKECISDDFIEQKLDYIHMNPCRYTPQLAINPFDYKHSSAAYYLDGSTDAPEARDTAETEKSYRVDSVMQMKDIKFNE